MKMILAAATMVIAVGIAGLAWAQGTVPGCPAGQLCVQDLPGSPAFGQTRPEHLSATDTDLLPWLDSTGNSRIDLQGDDFIVVASESLRPHFPDQCKPVKICWQGEWHTFPNPLCPEDGLSSLLSQSNGLFLRFAGMTDAPVGTVGSSAAPLSLADNPGDPLLLWQQDDRSFREFLHDQYFPGLHASGQTRPEHPDAIDAALWAWLDSPGLSHIDPSGITEIAANSEIVRSNATDRCIPFAACWPGECDKSPVLLCPEERLSSLLSQSSGLDLQYPGTADAPVGSVTSHTAPLLRAANPDDPSLRLEPNDDNLLEPPGVGPDGSESDDGQSQHKSEGWPECGELEPWE